VADAGAAMREATRSGPAPGTRWRHYKGSTYTVTAVVIRESDLSPLVVYGSDNSEVRWARPMCEWGQLVMGKDGRPVPRYRSLEPNPPQRG